MFKLEFSLLGRTVKVEFGKPSDLHDSHMKENRQNEKTSDRSENTPGAASREKAGSKEYSLQEIEDGIKEIGAIRERFMKRLDGTLRDYGSKLA